MSCTCTKTEEDRCCCSCDDPCSMECPAVDDADCCHNPTFRRLEDERDDEM